MFLKVFGLIAQVFLIKTLLGQCISNIGNSYAIGNYEGFVGNSNGILNSCGCANGQFPISQLTIPDYGIMSASSGGILNIQASSPIAPGTISVLSENQIQGPLSVYGTLPFLRAVAFEDYLPTHGSGAVNYQCGDGRVTILEENTSASGYDIFTPESFREGYHSSPSIGSGWGFARSGIDVYGGNGVGGVYANGMLPVEGYTTMAGQVPTIGVVSFDGPVQAKGTVSISVSCGCGCQF